MHTNNSGLPVQKMVFIDDDLFCHFVVEKMLGRYRDTIELACSHDGLAVFNQLKGNVLSESDFPDYIFVDVNMPLLSGWDFLELYKELSVVVPKTVHIYVMSSSVTVENKNKSAAYSFVSGFIPKPITKKSLEEVLCLTAEGRELADCIKR